MKPVQSVIAALIAAIVLGAGAVSATDRDRIANDDREPDERGIWGAIAYSVPDSRHGFFWGADVREEATRQALNHCRALRGSSCEVVATFRNHRHEDDESQGAVSFESCGSLAVAKADQVGSPAWGTATGSTSKLANDRALNKCQKGGDTCAIREWVCT